MRRRAEEALLDRLSAAVRRRLVADVPLGALLSGGVDSSAIVALMAETGAQPKTFSISFGERDYDETRYAQLVAERYGTRHEVRQLDPDDFSVIPRLAAASSTSRSETSRPFPPWRSAPRRGRR
jgi:asparagine synthase (glutamine-hydrolysing)